MKRIVSNGLVSIALIALSLTLSWSRVGADSSDPTDTGDDTYISPYNAALVDSGGSDESNPYVSPARKDWLKEVYGTTPPSDFGKRLMQELRTQQALYPQQVAGAQAPAGVPVWQSLGPTGANRTFNDMKLHAIDSGRLATILPHPTDPNTVYVLSASGGVWKTTDFTHPYPTWVPKSDGVFTTSGGAMAFGRDPNTLYLGLGDQYDGYGGAGGLMLRSTNGGDTWTPSPFINLLGAGSVMDVKVDTSQAQDIVMVGTDDGLFRSTDGGQSYTQIGPFNGEYVWSLAQTSAGWLASVVDPSTIQGSLFLSTDHGATWQPISNAGNGYSGAGWTTLGVGAPGDAVVYAFASGAGYPGEFYQGDLFRSTDGGQTWTALHLNSKAPTNPNPEQQHMDLMGFQGGYNQMILIDPTDPARNTVYLGGQLSSAKTTDGGQTWTLLTNWLALFGLPYAHADFHCAAFSALGGTPTVFFGSDGGLFISPDGGSTWSSNKNRGLVDTQHYSVASDFQKSQDIVTGLQDNGTRTPQGSSTLYDQVIGGDGEGTAWSQTGSGVVLGSIYYDWILRSTNNTLNVTKWQRGSSGIDRNDAPFFTALASPSATADPTGQVFYTTTFHHIYRTSDGANSWMPILNTGQFGPGVFVRPVLHPVGISPLDTNHIAAAGTSGSVFITTDGGATWKRSRITRPTVPGWNSSNSSVAWANNSVLYVANNALGYRATRVAKSTDGGTTWSPATTGLPDAPIHQLLVSPADPTGNTVYAATFLGVYQTTDGGQSWRLFGAGLPAVEVDALAMSPDGRTLLVATYGRGIWQITP